MKPIIVMSLPCPWCGKQIDITDCKSRRAVYYTLWYFHLYQGKCREKNKWAAIDLSGGLDTWRENLIQNRELPCPHCHVVMDTKNCKTDPNVRHIANKHSNVCASWPGYELSVGKDDAVKAWIIESQEIWRAKSPQCKLLTDAELRAAQSRGGKHQLKRDKRRGGENQSTYDKMIGGERAMHNRWHVKRGINADGCELCNPRIV